MPLGPGRRGRAGVLGGRPVARTAAVVGTAAVVKHGHDRRSDRRDDRGDRREDRRDDRAPPVGTSHTPEGGDAWGTPTDVRFPLLAAYARRRAPAYHAQEAQGRRSKPLGLLRCAVVTCGTVRLRSMTTQPALMFDSR